MNPMSETDDKINWSKMSSELDKFVVDGNKAVTFKLLRKPEDIGDESLEFHPEFCHQIFSSGEMIFGYENLKIKIYYIAGSLKSYLNIDYSRKITADQCDGVEPDNLVEKIETVHEKNYLTNLDDFTRLIGEEGVSFKPFGELLHSFTREFTVKGKENGQVNGNGTTPSKETKTFEIYSCNGSTPKFPQYCERIQSFLKWFIDAASMIQDFEDDERWKFYIMYEKYKTSEGETRYAFAGYNTVYEFYAFPANIRPKISQILILPPFQRQGLGVELYNTVCGLYRRDPKAIEITVEDPSDDMERLRDYADSRECMKLESFAPEKLKVGFSPEMQEEAKSKLKLTKLQAHRMYEILRLKLTNINNDKEMREYRLDVKRRLYIPYQKKEAEVAKMKKRKVGKEYLEEMAVDEKTCKTELESGFHNVLTHYQYIVKRLENYP